MVLSPSMLNVVATSLIFRLASTGNRKILLQDLSHVFSTTLLEQKTSLKQTEKWYGQRPKAKGRAVRSFTRTAITKYHRPSGLNGRCFLSPSPGGWKSEIKVLMVRFLLRPLSLWLALGSLLFVLATWCFFYVS